MATKVVPKRWGQELWIVNNDMYCGKILSFDQGKSCSLHCHRDKHETFYVLCGAFDILLMDLVEKKCSYVRLKEGQALEIDRHLYHAIRGLEAGNELLEVSTHHEDEDSYRMSKEDAWASNMEKQWEEYVAWEGKK